MTAMHWTVKFVAAKAFNEQKPVLRAA